jgi:hypothetical protein
MIFLSSIKLLSNEMNLAKKSKKLFIKGRDAEVFRKLSPSRIL